MVSDFSGKSVAWSSLLAEGAPRYTHKVKKHTGAITIQESRGIETRIVVACPSPWELSLHFAWVGSPSSNQSKIPMKALLIAAHGSRRKDSNDKVRRLSDRIRENSGPAFGLVASAFLEISSPQLDSAIVDLIEKGATSITVFPYFLALGSHVANDLPKIVDDEKENYPNISFEILPHLGALQGISNLILNPIYSSATVE